MYVGSSGISYLDDMMMMMRQAGEARKVKLDLLEEEEEEERGLFFRHSNHIANHTKKREEFGSLDLFLPRWIQVVVVVVRKVVGSSNLSVACLSLSLSQSSRLGEEQCDYPRIPSSSSSSSSSPSSSESSTEVVLAVLRNPCPTSSPRAISFPSFKRSSLLALRFKLFLTELDGGVFKPPDSAASVGGSSGCASLSSFSSSGTASAAFFALFVFFFWETFFGTVAAGAGVARARVLLPLSFASALRMMWAIR